MALYDKRLTEKVERAWDYFQKLEHKARDSVPHKVKCENTEMMLAASWAASFFSNPFMTKTIAEKLRKNGYYVPGAIDFCTAPNDVHQMVNSYINGNRTFVKYTFEQAMRVCRTLSFYMRLLEKEKEKITYEACARLTSTGNL